MEYRRLTSVIMNGVKILILGTFKHERSPMQALPTPVHRITLGAFRHELISPGGATNPRDRYKPSV